jgi:MAD (mothers against decapentaplegic) interacting protein
MDCEKENVDPNNAFSESSEIVSEVVARATEERGPSLDDANSELVPVKDDDESGDETSPPCYDQAVSLMEEMQDVAFLPGKCLKVNNHDDDYVDQRQVEEYLKQMKVEEDDYVDEMQVQEYLKEIELEKTEQSLLERVSDSVEGGEIEEDVIVDTFSAIDETSSENHREETVTEPCSAQSDNAPDEDQTENNKVTTSEDEDDPHLESLDRVLGARPKDPSPTNPPAYSESALCVSLEPSIPGYVPEPAPYVEEAEYLDLGSLQADLQPQIGRTESPPPYSEVDPMTEAEQSGVVASVRPTSLDLSGAGGEAAAPTDLDSESLTSEVAVLGAPGATPSNPTGPRVGQASVLAGLSEEQLMLGRVQPWWVPDSEAPHCMICGSKFTMVKRRHHCRACGKVLCAACCSEKHTLHYLEGKDGRVCTPCRTILSRLATAETTTTADPEPTELGCARMPNPANPMEYCSTVPVSEQVAAAGAVSPPSVLVPVGVLKRNGSTAGASLEAERENKSVMFSDGIRPGGDLTELDGRGGGEHRTLGRRAGRGRNRGRRGRTGGPVGAQDVCASMLPPDGLPLVSGLGAVEEEEVLVWFSAGTYVNFVMNKNLTVITKQLHYPPINKLCWNFATRGLTSVGQDEVVVLLEVAEDEQLPPREVFTMLQALYEQAGAGAPVAEMGHISVGSDYLGSNAHGGWLFIRHSHQAVADLLLPPPPLLFAVLIMRWEIPWARVFPLRLMLRLGAEFRYYPAPLVSVRGRKPVYGEIGHTIMNVLADFKNYTYALPTIRGMVIHMVTGRTDILLPKNRYDAVLKALNTSNETVLALGSNFSMSADSHLVAIQGEDGSYQTQAINILNKERKVTGASFVVFNGALKSTANLTAKSSIVEDGLMVQVLPDNMVSVRKALRNMENYLVGCGPVGSSQPDEVVSITWVDEDKAFNIGIKSVLDGKAMDGVSSLRIHSGPDMTQDRCLIRWTEVFLINTGESGTPTHGDPPDPARAAEGVARSVCVALMPHLAQLKGEGLSPLAVRVCLDPENVMYEAGSNGAPLPTAYMNSLDCELVPVLHSGSLQGHLTLELVFHILDH